MKTTMMKSFLSAILMTGLVGTTMMSPAMASDYVEQQVYRNGDFGQIAQKIRTSLRQQGYHMMDIKAWDDNGTAKLVVYAKKNNQAYKMTYSYPDLKRLTSEKKPWSQLHQDQHHGAHYHPHYNQQHRYGNHPHYQHHHG